MNKEIKLKLAKLPALVGSLSESNQFLKMFSILAGLIAIVLCVALLLVITRPPTVLPISAISAEEFRVSEKLPAPEQEVRAAIRRYLDRRYHWSPNDVKNQLAAAEAFILPANAKAYQTAAENVRRFSMEKVVSQKVYPEQIDVNVEKKLVRIRGDRLTEIQGLKAAGSLGLELSFESGPRTKENPWGVYITKEKEEM